MLLQWTYKNTGSHTQNINSECAGGEHVFIYVIPRTRTKQSGIALICKTNVLSYIIWMIHSMLFHAVYIINTCVTSIYWCLIYIIYFASAIFFFIDRNGVCVCVFFPSHEFVLCYFLCHPINNCIINCTIPNQFHENYYSSRCQSAGVVWKPSAYRNRHSTFIYSSFSTCQRCFSARVLLMHTWKLM